MTLPYSNIFAYCFLLRTALTRTKFRNLERDHSCIFIYILDIHTFTVFCTVRFLYHVYITICIRLNFARRNAENKKELYQILSRFSGEPCSKFKMFPLLGYGAPITPFVNILLRTCSVIWNSITRYRRAVLYAFFKKYPDK